MSVVRIRVKRRLSSEININLFNLGMRFTPSRDTRVPACLSPQAWDGVMSAQSDKFTTACHYYQYLYGSVSPPGAV